MADRNPGVTAASGKTGMLAFTIIWVGQMFSLVGTNMKGFALTIWAWQVTREATALSLVGFSTFAPLVLVSPIAGALVDRYDRKRIMMLADLAAGLPTVAVLLLYVAGNLQIWHLCVTGAVSGIFQAFHFPAYSAAVTTMLRKEQYGRANGMLSTAQFASGILVPVLAPILMNTVGIEGVLMIDIVTFLLAISMLLFVHIPRPPATEAGRRGMGSVWKESLYGFRYIRERPSLLGLLLVFLATNLVMSFGNTVLTPMILARTDNNKDLLGWVLSAGGIGGLAGSILLTVWGGPKRRVRGVLFGIVLVSLFGSLLTGVGRSVYVWTLASFLGLLIVPITNGSSQAIWQAKVAPDVQGRVFSSRLLIAQISAPLSILIAGPLADNVFEPGMQSGSLAPLFSWLVGTGPGAGMALMLVLGGASGALVGLVGYAIRVVRDVEDILPDHDTALAKQESSKQ